MVDGPHKTLNMQPHWKKVARMAANEAFGNDEVGVAVRIALSRDWERLSAAFLGEIEGVLVDGQGSIFPDHKFQHLHALRPSAGGYPVGMLLLDCVERQISQGNSGREALIRASEDALGIHGAAVSRQMEEHYWRESTARQSRNVRNRLEAGVSGNSLNGLARQLIDSRGTTTKSRQVRHRDGLEEGPKI